MYWQTLHRYAEQLLPWLRLEPSVVAAATLKEGVSAFFLSAYFETL